MVYWIWDGSILRCRIRIFLLLTACCVLSILWDRRVSGGVLVERSGRGCAELDEGGCR